MKRFQATISFDKHMSSPVRVLILFISIQAWLSPAMSDEITIAVAANFYPQLEKLKPEFERSEGHTMVIGSGSTGHLYAQIRNGAPYDVFLAADAERPELLEQQGLGVVRTRFTYALGRLALWGNSEHINISSPDILREDSFLSLAIANPELAPYGTAAQQTLLKLGLWEQVKSKIVMGENIGQTYSMIFTGNAELGFISLSQVHQNENINYWLVPADFHDPILQQAILLSRAEHNLAARSFLEFLKSDVAVNIITSSGYGLNSIRED